MNSRIEYEPSREKDLPRPLLVLIGAAVIGLGVLIFTISVRQIPHLAGEAALFSKSEPIASLRDIIEARRVERIAGRTVLMERQPVAGVIGDYIFYIGDQRGRVPVVMLGELTQRQPDTVVRVSEADQVQVFGFVLSMEEIDEISNEAFISAKEKEALKEFPVYIAALRVVVEP